MFIHIEDPLLRRRVALSLRRLDYLVCAQGDGVVAQPVYPVSDGYDRAVLIGQLRAAFPADLAGDWGRRLSARHLRLVAAAS